MSTPSPAPSVAEKGGAGFEGITMLLCENPLSPLPQAVDAAAAVLPRSNHYTEPHSAPLRAALGELLDVPEGLIHINSGSELILRQLFARLGERVNLVTPTYALFPEIAHQMTETRLSPETDFRLDLNDLDIPAGTTLVVLVNPNNPKRSQFRRGATETDPHPSCPSRLRMSQETAARASASGAIIETSLGLPMVKITTSMPTSKRLAATSASLEMSSPFE